MSGGDGTHVFVSEPVEKDDVSIREFILRIAETYVMKDRNADYSSPEDNFAQIAGLWSEYKRTPFTKADVAVMMILVKVARLTTSPGKLDNWVDIAGYAACGGEASSAQGAG